MKYFYFSLLLFFLFACGDDTSMDVISPSFISIDPEKSNIHFENKLVETEELNVVNYEYLYNGGGVGVGDFNNDGLEDLVFTGTMVDDQVYINKGDFVFEKLDLNFQFSKGFSTGVSVVDINNDGWDDIYISRTGKASPDERKNLLFVNNKDLSFTEAAEAYGIASNHHSNHSAFFDYDLDGDLDLFVLNHPIDFKSSQKIRVKPTLEGGYERILEPKTPYDSDQFYENTEGKFIDVSSKVGINNYGFGLSVSIVDVNEDHYPDIFVANDYIDTDILYVNQKDGTFKNGLNQYFAHISENSMGSDWADLNNDGHYDLMVVDMIAEDSRRQKKLVSSMTHERYHTLKRLGYFPQHMRNMLQLNNGGGRFSEVAHLTGMSNTDWSWAPLIYDFDNDGRKDVFISNGYRRDLSDCDYTLYKSDSISKSNTSSIQELLINIPETPVQNYLFQNKGQLHFNEVSSQWGLTQKTFSNGSASVDLNNDGALDLVINNVDHKPLILKNKTAQSNRYISLVVEGAASNRDAIGTYLEIYADSMIIRERVSSNRGYFSSVTKRINVGLGPDITLVDSIRIIWPTQEESWSKSIAVDSVIALKYDQLEKTSLAQKNIDEVFPMFSKQNMDLDFEHVENDFDDLRTQHLLPHCFSNQGPKISSDQNDEGYLFFGGAAGQKSKVRLPNGRYQELEGTEITEDLGACFFDLDKDGDLDLYVVAGGNSLPLKIENYQDKFYENVNGAFILNQSAISPTQSSGAAITSLDYDNDGDLDLFIGGRILPGNYPLSPISYVLENQEGKLIDRTTEIARPLQYGGMITDSDWVDVDGDGTNELVTIGEFESVKAYSFVDGAFTPKVMAGFEKTEGWWNVMQWLDIDDDGDLDLIAGNLGLNAKYKSSLDSPYTLFAYDFDDNGRVDPIACMEYKDGFYPIPARGDLLKQLPVLQRRLKNYGKYADSKMEEIISPAQLEKATVLKAYRFSSMLFLNNDGNFVGYDLPIEAQFSPIYAINYFKKDNKMFVLLGGNNDQANIESGPYDAGKLTCIEYLNKGQFRTLSLKELGVVVEDQIRSIEWMEHGGHNTLIIGCNNTRIKTLRLNS